MLAKDCLNNITKFSTINLLFPTILDVHVGEIISGTQDSYQRQLEDILQNEHMLEHQDLYQSQLEDIFQREHQGDNLRLKRR